MVHELAHAERQREAQEGVHHNTLALAREPTSVLHAFLRIALRDVDENRDNVVKQVRAESVSRIRVRANERSALPLAPLQDAPDALHDRALNGLRPQRAVQMENNVRRELPHRRLDANQRGGQQLHNEGEVMEQH